MQSKDLVDSFLESELSIHKNTLANVIRTINSLFKMGYTHSIFGRWRNKNNTRFPCRKIRLYMCKKSLRHVLETNGINTTDISDKKINMIAQQLQ